MKLVFIYDINKDVQNFINSLTSKNNNKRTEFHNLYVKQNGENFNQDSIQFFIQNYINKINITTKINTIRDDWELISDDFVLRIEQLFNYNIPDTVKVFLTSNNRCTYNVKENYFFVYINSKSTNAIIMHEIFHFYTYYVFYDLIKDPSKFNEIKESLTVILNLEFYDLMNGRVDRGYLQHQQLRDYISNLWLEDKNIGKIIKKILSQSVQ